MFRFICSITGQSLSRAIEAACSFFCRLCPASCSTSCARTFGSLRFVIVRSNADANFCGKQIVVLNRSTTTRSGRRDSRRDGAAGDKALKRLLKGVIFISTFLWAVIKSTYNSHFYFRRNTPGNQVVCKGFVDFILGVAKNCVVSCKWRCICVRLCEI